MKKAKLTSSADKIRAEIENHGGLKSFSSAVRKDRDKSRPMKRMMTVQGLQSLSNQELNVAWRMGLIGNASGRTSGGRIPTIVLNCKA